jgi:ABC-type transporter Mla MlaB component
VSREPGCATSANGFCPLSARQSLELQSNQHRAMEWSLHPSGWKVLLMIRVFTANEPNAITLTIDGQLVGEYVDSVETSTNEAVEEKKPVHLFLRNVSHIDERGRTLLAHLAAKGVQLSASGVYSSYVVEEIRQDLIRRHQSLRLPHR